jgi:Na+/H+ antiporter NhaD/arsenite permease-like protein
VTYGTAHSVGIALNPLLLFGVALGANLVLMVAAYTMFGGFALLKNRAPGSLSPSDAPRFAGRGPLPAHPFEREGLSRRSAAAARSGLTTLERVDGAPAVRSTMNATQLVTVVCMLGLLSSVILLAVFGLDPDIGILCFAFASVMTLVDPKTGKTAVGKIDWSTVLMVGGIITFVGVLQKMGAVELLGEAASHIGAPLLAALVICLIGGLVSAFASTTGMLAALVPLAIPLVASGDIAGWALIAALGVCSSIVDVSPFSTVGATLVATVEEDERPRINRLLTRWGMSMVLIGPLGLVGTLVLPTMF